MRLSENIFPADRRFLVRPGPTDMRKSINTLSVLAKESMGISPFTEAYFLFCNRGCRIIKILYWHRNGFALWMKRLDRHRFPWPRSAEECMELTEEKVLWLLSGIDFRSEHGEVICEKIG